VKTLRSGGQSWSVEVRRLRGGRVQVAVGGEVFEPDVRTVAPGSFLVRSGGLADVLHCVRDGDAIHLHWRGEVYRLDEEAAGPPRAARHAPGDLEAPMPGTVIRIDVAAGDRVSRGQQLLVVEAMKMENTLRAPRAGVVTAIRAEVGEMVAPGRTLVELEPVEESS
jgi:3-methylcrotonyl-CoA carboxylase alpha subunit